MNLVCSCWIFLALFVNDMSLQIKQMEERVVQQLQEGLGRLEQLVKTQQTQSQSQDDIVS